MKILILSLIILAIGAGIMLTLPSSKPIITSPINETVECIEVSIPHEEIIVVRTPTIPKEVKVWTDLALGFNRIRGVNITDYPNITINVNDTVTWINDDMKNFPIYIVSKEDLWTSYQGRLLSNYRHISYTFNNTGNYTVTLEDGRRYKTMIIGVI